MSLEDPSPQVIEISFGVIATIGLPVCYPELAHGVFKNTCRSKMQITVFGGRGKLILTSTKKSQAQGCTWCPWKEIALQFMTGTHVAQRAQGVKTSSIIFSHLVGMIVFA